MNKVHLLYKSETGKNPNGGSIEVTRMKRRWFIEFSDQDVLEIFGYTGIIEVPNTEYIAWLEEIVEQLAK
jgi:hypothetical protein